MTVKENVMIAGGVAAVIGIGKALTSGVHIPGWITIVIWLPILVVLAYAGYSIFRTSKAMEAKQKKREQKNIE